VAAGTALHVARPWRLPFPARVRVVAGACTVAAGAVDLAEPTALVTAGPYAASRHPMYLAWALLHAGVGLLSGSAWVVVTLPAAAGWVHAEAVSEERSLAARFPAEFARYRAAVPRYVAARRAVPRLVQC
jgi:protein-S-isoprenylcysteine O-methyltransferase Ste14